MGDTRDEVAKQTVSNLGRTLNVIQEFGLYPFAVGAQRSVLKQCTDIIRFVFHKWNSGTTGRRNWQGKSLESGKLAKTLFQKISERIILNLFL